MSWDVGPLAGDPAGFNPGGPQLRSGIDIVAAHTRLAVGLEERLTRLERRERAAAPRAAAPLPAAAEASGQLVFPDYFAYESRMRGATELVREKQRVYVEDFRDAAPVVDLGCGRGEFLSLLREAGIESRGVDVDPDMVAYARGEGLEVEHVGAVEYLGSLPAGSLGGIFAAQLVEHLPAPAVVRLLE